MKREMFLPSVRGVARGGIGLDIFLLYINGEY